MEHLRFRFKMKRNVFVLIIWCGVRAWDFKVGRREMSKVQINFLRFVLHWYSVA